MEKIIKDLITERKIGIFPMTKNFLYDMDIEFAKIFFAKFFIIDIIKFTRFENEVKEFVITSEEIPALGIDETVPRVYKLITGFKDDDVYIDIAENKEYKLHYYDY